MVTHAEGEAAGRVEETGRGRVWRGVVVAAVLGAGLSLRPAVTSLGALLEEVRAELLMNATVAGVLTALPVVCFAGLGALAPRAAGRLGPHRMVLAALLAIAVGLAGRSLASGAAVFLAESLLALAGIAVVNVLLPPLVKEHFPDRIGLMTGLYAMSVAVGVSLPAAVSVPIGEATGGGWRGGLGVWAAVAALAALPWMALAKRGRAVGHAGPKRDPEPAGDSLRLVRSPTAIALTAFFGMQSFSGFAIMGWLPAIYRGAGLSADHAAALLALTAVMAIPAALIIPMAAARRGQAGYVVAAGVATAGGYVGLLFDPAAAPLLWAALLASAHCTYPLAITLINLRSRDAATAARLSGFVQGGGYTIAAVGPFAVGALLDVTGGWTTPLTILLGALCVQLVAGLLAARPRYVEDETARTRQGMRYRSTTASHMSPRRVTCARLGSVWGGRPSA